MECKGENGIAKREEVVDVLRKGKFELLALTETKLKGNGEVSLCLVNSIIAGFQEIEKAREDIVVLMNDEWYSALIGFGCVSSWLLWVKFNFSRVKVYGPTEGEMERKGEVLE